MNTSILDFVPNILIVYYNTQFPLRSTILDHLYSFNRYAGARCFYFNAAIGGTPRYLRFVRFDLVVFHTTLLSIRWHRPTFEKTVEKIRKLKELSGVKIALPQDEFINMDLVCNFINEFKVSHIFSVAMPSEWEKIYKTVRGVKFHPVYTGYLENSTVNQIERLARDVPERPIDIGYRAWKAEPWLGRHGFLKTYIAEVFQHTAPQRGFVIDISTRVEDTLYGNAWNRFLLRCRYTIGVEGGASLLDWDGAVRARTQMYLQLHPNASFAEVEAACFPGLDGNLDFRMITPRHFEACATKTCQILVEGDYNGVIKAGVHYIEVKRDFSNIEEVLTQIRNDTLRKQIVDNAHRDIVESGLYGYDRFVQFVLETALQQNAKPRVASEEKDILQGLIWRWMQLRDRFSQFLVWGIFLLMPLRTWFVSLLIKTSFGQKLRDRRQARASRP